MTSLNDIYEAIDADGFKESTLQLIDELIYASCECIC